MEDSVFKQMSKLKLLSLKVHSKKEYITTIDSFSNVYGITVIKVILDSDLAINFVVILPTGQIYCLKRVNAKLFYFETAVDTVHE